MLDDNNTNTSIEMDLFNMYRNEAFIKLSKMKSGDSLTILMNEYFGPCKILYEVRFDSLIFRGRGSKDLAKYYMEKINEEKMTYSNIVQIISDDGKRQFIIVKCMKKLWKDYFNEKIEDRYLSEVILSHKPCKPYLDIDWKIDDGMSLDLESFISELKLDIVTIFKNRYQIDISKKNIKISESHSEKKISFHIVISKCLEDKTQIGFETNRKGYKNSAWDLWKALSEMSKYSDKLDEAVYSKDREFRSIYSNKFGEYRPLWPNKYRNKKKLPSDKCLEYFVTNCSNDSWKLIQTPEIKGIKEQKKYSITFDSIPTIVTNEKIKYYLELVKHIHPTAYCTGGINGGMRFSYCDKMEKCYTGLIHESNGFYIFDGSENIVMRCMSEKCKNRCIVVHDKTNQRKSIFNRRNI
jgi:hypothetical protein